MVFLGDPETPGYKEYELEIGRELAFFKPNNQCIFYDPENEDEPGVQRESV